MWVVVGSALAARCGQAIIVALIALVACAAVAAAPWYAAAATERVAVAAVAGTPAEARMVSIDQRLARDEPLPDDPAGEVRRVFAPAEFSSVTGGVTSADLDHDGRVAEVNLAQRERVCDHLELTGECPATGEVVLPAALADELAVAVGDELTVMQAREELGTLRVAGRFQVADPTDPYWGRGELVGLGSRAAAAQETAFIDAATLADLQRVTYTHELVAEPEAFATLDLDEFEAELAAGVDALRRQEYAVSTNQLETMFDRIRQDREHLTTGLAVGVLALLLLTWFALVVVLRGAVVEIRGDVGWWRLHGVPSGRGWVSVLGQSVVPLLVGAGLGTAAGLGTGLSRTVAPDAEPEALRLALGLVGFAVAGGLVAIVATQLGSLRTPVRDLLRRVPPRRGRWRRSLVDLVVIALAAGAVGQALLVDSDASLVARLAPGLAVLAIALVAAWALPPVAAVAAARGLRAGRLAVALVAAPLARQTGTHRLFALVAVAVGLLTAGLVGWDTASRDQHQRAALETGADRVVTVATVDAARLLAAVRAADPAGTQAMAVVQRGAASGHPPVLALDATRLAAVVPDWRRMYGSDAEAVAAALRPAPLDPVEVTDELAIEASADGAPMLLRVGLRTLASGEPVEAMLGPLRTEPTRYTAELPECASGCRLVGIELLGPESAGGYAAPEVGTEAQLRLADLAGTADPARWRPALGPRDLGPSITAGEHGLRLRVPERPAPDQVELTPDGWALLADAPAPLPVLAAGWRPEPGEELRATALTRPAVPAELVGTAPLLPQLGRAGVLVDLEYAERLTPFAPAGGISQVWLAPTAPASIMDDLRAAGLRPLRVDSRADRVAELRGEGSAVAGRFQAAVAAVGLLLATGGVLALAAQQRPGRAAELSALRAQGLPAAVTRLVGYGSPAVVIGAASVVGLVAGLAGAAVARVGSPGFVDGWQVLPVPPPHPLPVAGAAAAAAVLLGGAVLAAAAALVRQVGGAGGPNQPRSGTSS